ncbi:MAG: exodeoxyribonuclease III [Actinomycetota bacterium]
MKIISWNVNGIRAIYDKGFMDFMDFQDADIVCLQETKANLQVIPRRLANLSNYHSYFSKSTRSGYSGVAIYSKKEPKLICMDTGAERFDREGRLIRADFNDFILFNVYFPNGGRSKQRLHYKLDFYTYFLDYISYLKRKGKKIVIAGDFNTAHKPIDLARPRQNINNTGFLPVEREWIDRLVSTGFIDSFRYFNKKADQYTWWDYKTRSRERNVGWRLDYFFASSNLEKSLISSNILSFILGSDHCPLSLEIGI